jgi:hypothetical protein
MAGTGSSLLAGVQGYETGLRNAEARHDRQTQRERQVKADARVEQDQAYQDEVRGAEREERGMRMDEMRLSKKQRDLMLKLTSAYVSRNPQALMDLYNEIPDGQTITELPEMTPDGRVRIKHPMGVLEGTWDEAFFGNPGGPDGKGFSPGLYHFINPEALLQGRSAAADRGAELAANQLKHERTLEARGVTANASVRAAEIRAAAARDVEASRAARASAPSPAGLQVVEGPDGYSVIDKATAAARPVADAVPGDGMGPPEQLRPAPPKPAAGADPMKQVNTDLYNAARNAIRPEEQTPAALRAAAGNYEQARTEIAEDRGLAGVPGSAPPKPKAVQQEGAKSGNGADGAQPKDRAPTADTGAQGARAPEKRIVRTGIERSTGRKVVQYEDGTRAYADEGPTGG